ncbi:d-4,5 unsaturated-glucuronyl hydrolase-like protein [Daedaleopsis nitida]|nr:d-4,5 unsaturated-glucuronyl hydrolase-like protein [Daedaleopsis nitida]
MLATNLVALAIVGQIAAIVNGSPHVPSELFSPLVAQKVLKTALEFQHHSPPQYPQLTDRVKGEWQWFDADGWTTGFFPATLYAMYERTKLCHKSNAAGNAAQWLELGRTWATGEISLESHNSVGHDVGFLSFPFMDELNVNSRNETAEQAVNAFAADLAARFSPIVGCTRSWDASDPTDFQVIIDNMMNLEVFFASAKLTGNQTLIDMANSHADKTMHNHIRPDGSSYHVVDYNSATGAVIRQRTSQGYADDSTWSRGQAWGIYGFANMHKHTNKPEYLQTARRMAKYFITHIPSDGIVPWDFNAPLVPAPRAADTSAATIAVNGLLLLADREKAVLNFTGSAYYEATAKKILADTTKFAWAPSWESLLSNGTVNNPVGNNLTGIVYGDYYFIKAGNEFVSRHFTSC